MTSDIELPLPIKTIPFIFEGNSFIDYCFDPAALEKLNITQLKQLCKKYKIWMYSGSKRADYIERLTG